MNTLDIGCGPDPERWFPGADLLENNFIFDEGDPRKPGVKVYSNIDLVPCGRYDLLVSSYSFRYNDPHAFRNQCRRIAKPKATLLLRDYREWLDWNNDAKASYPTQQNFRDWFRYIWTSLGDWNLDSFAYTQNGKEFTAVLTLGWG